MLHKPTNPVHKKSKESKKPEKSEKKPELIKASSKIRKELKCLFEILKPSDDELKFNVIIHNIVLDDDKGCAP